MRTRRAGSFLAIVVLAACGGAPPTPRGASPEASSPQSASPHETPPSAASPSTEGEDQAHAPLRLATFNIQVFGRAKAGKPEVMAKLAEIVRGYDLVAVQEVKDTSGEAPRRLLELVNAAAANDNGTTYALALSPRTGREPDDLASQEQYAYYYRTDRLRVSGEPTLFDDAEHDYFQREPYLSRFELVDGHATFVVINIHTRPRSAVSEIAAMEHVFAWAKAHFAGEDTFVAVGDFNAGCGYASEADLDALPIHGTAYDWVVPHSADTNLADSQCPYDRIVIAAPEGNRLVERWGVDRAFHDRVISDHWPVWVELRWAPARPAN